MCFTLKWVIPVDFNHFVTSHPMYISVALNINFHKPYWGLADIYRFVSMNQSLNFFLQNANCGLDHLHAFSKLNRNHLVCHSFYSYSGFRLHSTSARYMIRLHAVQVLPKWPQNLVESLFKILRRVPYG